MNRVAIARRKRFFQGLLEQGMRSGTAVVLQQSPHLTYYSAKETSRRMLADIDSRPEFTEEQAKIADLKELDEISTRRARDDQNPKADKYTELLYRRNGALTDRNINENIDATPGAMVKAAEEALKLVTANVAKKDELNKPSAEIKQK